MSAAGETTVRVKYATTASTFRPLALPADATGTELKAACAKEWGLNIDSICLYIVPDTDTVDRIDNTVVSPDAARSSWRHISASSPVVRGTWVLAFGATLSAAAGAFSMLSCC